jgi:hypothetical protein
MADVQKMRCGLLLISSQNGSGTPNVHHLSACTGELLGESIPMKGQILIAGGRYISTSQGPAVVLEQSDEAKAFARWGNREFDKLEYEYARKWRASLAPLDRDSSSDFLRSQGIGTLSCETLKEAWQLALEIVDGEHTVLDAFQFVFSVLNVPFEYSNRIISAWKSAGCPRLADHAPYTAYVMSLQFFFHIAVANNLISTRRSNSTDAAYLFYLPFCQVFVSSDRLHKQIVPLFKRDDQMFIWGLDLKKDLARLNEHYSQLPDETKEQGVIRFAPQPPQEGDFLVSSIWDQLFPRWRSRRAPRKEGDDRDIMDLMEEIKKKSKCVESPSPEIVEDITAAPMISLKRQVRRKKGSWFQVPKDLENDVE